jgi:hypothetical protein
VSNNNVSVVLEKINSKPKEIGTLDSQEITQPNVTAGMSVGDQMTVISQGERLAPKNLS